MSLKHLLALAGLAVVAACENPAENQPLCWLSAGPEYQGADVQGEYRCLIENPPAAEDPVSAADIESGTDEED
jgi:hypothetical protein